jgi:hypothetical protein
MKADGVIVLHAEILFPKAFQKQGLVHPVGILSAVFLLLSFGCRPQPPDLTGCTRLEIRYGRDDGLLYHLGLSSGLHASLLSQQERDYLRSNDKWVLTDQNSISIFAQQVKRGTYQGKVPQPLPWFGVHVTGYREHGPRTSFTIYGETLIADGRTVFKYSLRLAEMPLLEPPGVETLRLRAVCSSHLRMLDQYRTSRSISRLPPLDPNHWCGTYVTSHHADGQSDTRIIDVLTCPSVHRPGDSAKTLVQPTDTALPCQDPRGWVSDFAMNPNCGENSPGDMVFLFEAMPGWNQHGGPELFNFDNHDPKGGCVLLNDGTVKFIRTKEELVRLRWKP